jgi:hypothetical protein
LDDENAEFDFDGLVNLNPDQEQYKFSLKMLGADLKKLHFIEKDIRMSFTAEANFKGNGLNNLNGTAGVNNIVIVNDEKTYKLESFLSASVTNLSEANSILTARLLESNI